MVRADHRRDRGRTSDQGLVTGEERGPHAGRFRGTGVARAAQAWPRSALILKATRGPWFETRPCGPLLTMETFARVKDHDSLHRLSRGGRQWDSGGLGNSALWMRR